MGGSYGGYATLVGLTFTPEAFACGVDIVGPSNLETLLETIPPYWEPMVKQFHERMGNPKTPEGKALLIERSPLLQGRRDQPPAADRPGRQRPARQAGRKRPDRRGDEGEGHPGDLRGVPRRRPRLRQADQQHRLQRGRGELPPACLGGRAEPMGETFKASTAQVLAGAQYTPGLEAATK